MTGPSHVMPHDEQRHHHVSCARCGKHLLIIGFYKHNRIVDSVGGMLFDDPGPVCDCCLGECRMCKR